LMLIPLGNGALTRGALVYSGGGGRVLTAFLVSETCRCSACNCCCNASI
jgi:hypothetical protein